MYVSGFSFQTFTNGFKIFNEINFVHFLQVSISFEDRKAVENKVIGRKIMEKLYDTYSSELAGKPFAYDGEKALYTVGPLPWNKQEFMVVLEESIAKRFVVSSIL